MSFALLIIGIMMITSAVRGTQHCLVETVKGDFRGQGNFTYWVAALLLFGILGYSETLRPLSQALLVLVILVLFLTKGTGFFARFQQAIGSTGAGTASTASTAGSTATGFINQLTIGLS